MAELSENDRLELYLGRVIVPRLIGIERCLEQLNSQLDRVSQQAKFQSDIQASINEDVRKHDKILNGNGEEGVVALVLRFKEWIDEQKRFQWFITTTLISTLVGVAVTIGYILLKIR